MWACSSGRPSMEAHTTSPSFLTCEQIGNLPFQIKCSRCTRHGGRASGPKAQLVATLLFWLSEFCGSEASIESIPPFAPAPAGYTSRTRVRGSCGGTLTHRDLGQADAAALALEDKEDKD